MQVPFPTKPSGLPIMKKSDFDVFGTQILTEKMPEVLKEPMALDIKFLAEERIIVDILEEELYPDNILGFVAFDEVKYPLPKHDPLLLHEGTIVLDKRLHAREARWRFTFAHELSHWVLHRSYFRQDGFQYQFRKMGHSYIASHTDNSELGKKNPKEAKTDDEWAEWQADNLAAALLMPRDTFLLAARKSLIKHGFTSLQLISGQNIDRGKQVVSELADTFQVSMRAVRIRMRYYDMYVGDM